MLHTLDLQNKFGKYVVGYDLVDEEDRYFTLLHYLEEFLKISKYTKQHHLPPLKYYFHAGETFWNKRSHENLYDAILLNTTRIGHGLAVKDHPLLMNIIKKIMELLLRFLLLVINFFDMY